MTDDIHKKLDSELWFLTQRLQERAAPTVEPAGPNALAAPRDPAHRSKLEADAGCIPQQLYVYIRCHGEVAELVAAGLVNPVVFDLPDPGLKLVSGDLAPERVADIAALAQVISISWPPPLQLLLNYSVPEARARVVQSGPHGLTGNGVMIGIIDAGLDWRHGSFQTPSGGTRIRAIWDHNLTPLPAHGSQPAETGYLLGSGATFGVVYDSDWINQALAGQRQLRTTDVEASSGTAGHGTHVAGIAAGDGSPRDCCAWSRFTYTGVAPGAEIIAVRVDKDVKLGLALDFIRSMVTDKPVVVNISMGGNFGPHDGTTNLELAINSFVTPTPGFPTRVVVCAAGNSAADKRHVAVTVPSDGARQAEIAVEVGAKDSKSRTIELWYLAGQQMSLEVIAPDGTTSGVVAHGANRNFVLNAAGPIDDRVNVRILGVASDPNNHDPSFKVQLSKPRPGHGTLVEGAWKLRLTNTGAVPAEVHAWVAVPAQDPVAPIFPAGSSSGFTISTPASAQGAIAVANYESRGSWSDCCPSGEVVDSSSRGPVRAAAADNPKPTLAAPGEDITSARADACTLKGNCCHCLPEVCCSQYISDNGTSMAAPHVAGAAALMLELDPTMTQADIVRYLTDKARPSGDHGVWGAGKLDVAAAIQLMRDLRPLPAAPPSLVRSTAAPARTGGRAAGMPVPITTRTAIELLRARARALPAAELCLALVSRHFSEARRLVNSNRRVATMWHRAQGPNMLRRLLFGSAAQPAAPLVVDAAQRAYVARFLAQLHQHGSPRLQASLDSHRATLLEMFEVPLAGPAAA